LAAVTVSVAPYVRIDLAKQLGAWAYTLPLIGEGVALAATWLFIAEQYRCYSVLQHYRTLIGKERIHRRDTGLYRWLDRLKVRWVTPSVFLISYTILTVLDIFILRKLL
jgi:hypothetical protein